MSIRKKLAAGVASIALAATVGIATAESSHAGAERRPADNEGTSTCSQWVRLFWTPWGGTGPWVCVR